MDFFLKKMRCGRDNSPLDVKCSHSDLPFLLAVQTQKGDAANFSMMLPCQKNMCQMIGERAKCRLVPLFLEHTQVAGTLERNIEKTVTLVGHLDR